MKRNYIFDENDELDDENLQDDAYTDGFGPDGRIELDDPYGDTSYTEDDEDDESPLYERPMRTSGKKTLLSALEDELMLIEPKRGELEFRYRGVDYVGVPMLKINDTKFVFKCMVDGKEKLMSVILPEIIVHRI